MAEEVTENFLCSYCPKSFIYKSGLSRHVKKEHLFEKHSNSNIVCNECSTKFTSTDGLIQHLRNSHNHTIPITTENFTTMAKFMEWKEGFETRSCSSFVQHSSPKQCTNYLAYYYYCNRTGKYDYKGKGVRSLKLQGSSKLGYHCTAYMRVRQYTSGLVEAEVCDYHLHEKKLAHLLLNESTRKMIVAKLQEGVAISSILDYIRDNVQEQIGRRELVNRQDIRNICHQYNIEGIKLHPDDSKSVSLWVEGINTQCEDNSTNNPVLLFKPQGIQSYEGLGKDDFAICMQTPFQRDMLVKFGPDVICIDSTHGTNGYDFNLITVLVLDEYGEGIPVGWMICNREDATALSLFMGKIKERCGDIRTKVFMSDDAENFYNAWKSIFTVDDTRKLLCAWHIDKSWRKGLQNHVESKEKQAEVYHHLRVLLGEADVGLFQLRLQQFISWLLDSKDNEMSKFLEYFQREYVKRVEQWAPCYRDSSLVNTNMALEAFHRLIKVCYMEKKQNRRVDYLLHVLLKVARDKVFERLQKTQKGKSSYRLCEINRRHKTAEKLSADVIISVNKDLWKVKPSSTKQLQSHYTVEKVLDNCLCALKCGKCNACVHLYSCTCMDFLIHSTVCKHIHFVKILSESSRNDSSPVTHEDPTHQQDVSDSEVKTQDDLSLQGVSHLTQQDDLSLQSVAQLIQQDDLPFQDASQQETIQQDHLSLHSISQKGTLCQQETLLLQPANDLSLKNVEDTKSFAYATDNNEESPPTLNLSSLEYLSSHMNQSYSDIVSAKDKAKAICKKIEIAITNCLTVDSIKAGETHLKNALKVLESINETDAMKLKACKRIAPNSNSEQQPRFYSTRQKRARTVSLSKPNEEEIVECRDKLQQVEIQVCGKCMQINDKQPGDIIEWIQCDHCSMWFHCSCVNVNQNDTFWCQFCV